MHGTGATSDNVGVDHHVGKASVAVERMIEVKLDNRLFFLVCRPLVYWDLGIVLVRFAVTTRPFAERAAVQFRPLQDRGLSYLCFVGP